MTLVDRICAATRAFLGVPKPPPEPKREAVVGERPSVPLFERDPEMEGRRREHAMSLMDDDVLAYAIVTARGDLNGGIEVKAAVALDAFVWPAMSNTMGRLVLEGDKVHGG